MKEKVRPLYSELQGYLEEAPVADRPDRAIGTPSVWERYNQAIAELSEISGKDYSRFKLTPMGGQIGPFVRIIDYRQKLGGLIARLHGEYFSDEQAPFAGMPSTIIQQTQSQSVDIQMLLTIQSKIDEQLAKFSEGSKEKSFLQKLKTSLTGVKDVVQLMSQLVITAKNTGLSVEDLAKIFS